MAKLTKNRRHRKAKLADSSEDVEFRRCLNQFRKEEMFTDVVVTVGNSKFPAHRNVLAARSEKLKKMLLVEIEANNSFQLNLPNIVHENIFEGILEYIYTGNTAIDAQNAKSFSLAAYYLGLKDLLNLSENCLCRNLKSENALNLYFFSKQLSLEGLNKICQEKIAENCWILKEDTTNDLSVDQIKELLLNLSVHIKNKHTLFELLLNWIRFKVEERRDFLLDLMKTLPMILVSRNYLCERILTEPLVVDDHACVKELSKTFSKHISGKIYIIGNLRSESEPILNGTENGMSTPSKSGMIVLNGYDDECTFTTIEPKIENRFCCTVFGSTIYLFNEQFNAEFKTEHTENTWKVAYQPESKKNGFGYTSSDEYLYSFAKDSVKQYNPESNISKNLAAMLDTRFNFELLYLDGFLYALGGCKNIDDPNASQQNTVERYSLTEHKWEAVQPMNHALVDFSSVAFDNKIYIAKNDIFEVYEPFLNTWTALPNTNMVDVQLTVFNRKQLLAVGRNAETYPDQICLQEFNTEEKAWKVSRVINAFDMQNYRVVAINSK